MAGASGALQPQLSGGALLAESGLVSLDTVPSSVFRGETLVTLGASGGGFGATQGLGGVTYNGEPCTVTSWSDTSVQVTIPSTIALQHSTTGYSFIVTSDDGVTETGSTYVPFNEPSGWDYVNLVSPVTTSGSLLQGYSGDTPVTGDQLVYTTPTSPESIAFTVEATGEWVLDSTPTVDNSISVYVIQADGTLGTTGTYTWEVSGGAGPFPTGEWSTYMNKAGRRLWLSPLVNFYGFRRY